MKKTLLNGLLLAGVAGVAFSAPAYAGGEPAGQSQQVQTKTVSGAKAPRKIEHHDTFKDAILGSRAFVHGRIRYEEVDTDGLLDGEAFTARTRIGFETGIWKNFKAWIEMENVTHLADDDFNDTTNGRVDRAVIADPSGTELEQAYITYLGVPDTKIKAGRQQIVRGNERFVSWDWRQNGQVFDAIVLENSSVKDLDLFYAYSSRVHRIFGDDNALGEFNSDIHLIDATYNFGKFGKLMGYAYLLELNNLEARSSQTYGISYVGNVPVGNGFNVLYRAEYAYQEDFADNPINFDTDYYHFVLGGSYKGVTAKAGYEVLGSEGGVNSFQTPLANVLKFNGLTDQFAAATPANGLEDAYVEVSYEFSNVNKYVDGTHFYVRYHDFESEDGGVDFGDEINFELTVPVTTYADLAFEYANFDADAEGGLADEELFAVTLTFELDTFKM